jgi:phage terminase small subunit
MARTSELETTTSGPDPQLPPAAQLLAGLTERQARFAQLYARDGNASKACRDAGYSVKNAGNIGPKLAKKPSVRQAIHALRAELVKAGEAKPQEILAQLQRQALGDVTDLLIRRDHQPIDSEGAAHGPVQHVWAFRSPDELTPTQRALIASVSLATRHLNDGTVRQTISYKVIDQQRAIEQLARIMGLNSDSTTHHHSGEVAHKVSGVFAFIASNPGAAETTQRIGQNRDGRRQPVTVEGSAIELEPVSPDPSTA